MDVEEAATQHVMASQTGSEEEASKVRYLFQLVTHTRRLAGRENPGIVRKMGITSHRIWSFFPHDGKGASIRSDTNRTKGRWWAEKGRTPVITDG